MSPTTMARPVVTIASHATRASGSLARIASRMASEIWSASLSGWPSVTDSDVNRDGIADGPPSNLPRRQGRTTVCARPQAPGSYLWDERMLSRRDRRRPTLRRYSCEVRPLRYSINVTLDGGCDHREGFADEDLHRHAVDNLHQADALLFGRGTYAMMESAWRRPAPAAGDPQWADPLAHAVSAVKM